MDELNSEFSINYKVLQKVKLAARLRHSLAYDAIGNKQGYENHLQYFIDVSFKHGPAKFAVKNRLRYQNGYELGAEGALNRRLRLKSSVHYDVKAWNLAIKPYTEIFYQLGSAVPLDRYRLGTGFDFRIDKRNYFLIEYRFDNRLPAEEAAKFSTMVLKYQFTFK